MMFGIIFFDTKENNSLIRYFTVAYFYEAVVSKLCKILIEIMLMMY